MPRADEFLIDWAYFEDHRILNLWQVASLAAGLPIDVERRGKARDAGPERVKKFKEIRSYLKRKLTWSPTQGYVTQIDEPKNVFNAQIDVLTAIEVLKKKFSSDLHPGFLALEATLLDVGLPKRRDAELAQQFTAGAGALSMSKPDAQTGKRDQTKGNKTKADERALLVIYGMALANYKLQGHATKELKHVAKLIHGDLNDVNALRFGLSKEKILEMLTGGAGVFERVRES